MSNTDWLTSPDRACRDRLDLFAHPALDYDPDDADYRNLSPAEHARAAAEKARVEEEAVNVCFGCKFMAECEVWALRTNVHGVAGGRTAAERQEIRARDGIDTPVEANEVTTHANDRGVRGQVNDAAVARLADAGWTDREIADEISCSTRTVSRSRSRTATLPAVKTMSAAASPVPAPVVTLATGSGRTATTVQAPPRTGRTSTAMEAIYDILADREWHSRDSLVSAGILFVDDKDAIDWWTARTSRRLTQDAKDRTSREQRVARGARDKVSNALAASARTRHRTLRGGPDGTDKNLYRINSTNSREES